MITHWLQITGLVLDMFGVYWMSRGLLLKEETIEALSAANDVIYRIQRNLTWDKQKNLTLEIELKKNKILAKQGLIIIGVGFLLQTTALIIQ